MKAEAAAIERLRNYVDGGLRRYRADGIEGSGKGLYKAKPGCRRLISAYCACMMQDSKQAMRSRQTL